MRPINKGIAPAVFADYSDAKQPLTNRIGSYCSYCERRIATNLAIEHILPKNPALGYAHLRNEWTNFLLACVNCNSAKGDDIMTLNEYLLPDRDNTFPYYVYLDTGMVEANAADNNIRQMAQNTLDLVSLNNAEHLNWDEDTMFSALERFGQRVQVWVQAREARQDYDNGEVNARRISAEATSAGFFSIWMKVFEGVTAVRLRLIEDFGHTAADCFDDQTNPITPRPINGLDESGKA